MNRDILKKRFEKMKHEVYETPLRDSGVVTYIPLERLCNSITQSSTLESKTPVKEGPVDSTSKLQ
jgi:hypothetical protein